jgi:hypothetical protein
VAVCNEIALLILYFISSRQATLLKIIEARTQVSDIFYISVSFKFINFSFQIFLPFIPEMSASVTSSIFEILLKALQLWRRFGLPNEFFPLGAAFDAVLPICYFLFLLCQFLHHPPTYFRSS